MLLTREQLQELDKDAIIEYALKVSDLTELLQKMEERIGELEGYNVISKNCNTLLKARIDRLEEKFVQTQKKTISNSQYARNRQLEIHRFPLTVPDVDLKKSVCSILSLTGQVVRPSDLDKCHRLKKKDTVIMEFKFRDRRDPVLDGRKNLKDKKGELTQLGMDKVIITESLCYEYKELDFLCRRLKQNKKIADTWFYNGKLFLKHKPEDKHGIQITHVMDLYQQFSFEEINSYLT